MLFFDHDGTIGTHSGAHRAADAGTFVRAVGGKHTFLVAFLMLNRNDLLGTGSGAEFAALAAVENDAHLRHSHTIPFFHRLKRRQKRHSAGTLPFIIA